LLFCLPAVFLGHPGPLLTGVILPVDTVSVAAEKNFTEKKDFLKKRSGRDVIFWR
jgi:hypothetical protein